MDIDGAIGASIVDADSGVPLGTMGGETLDMELAAAASTVVVQEELNLIDDLELQQAPEDILISLNDQYHLLRFFHATGDVFMYLVLDRAEANLALARRQLEDVDQDLELK
jgi:predicted regulator of Ras-like GTPase activity (Roadblock/LC7/MglB family)